MSTPQDTPHGYGQVGGQPAPTSGGQQFPPPSGPYGAPPHGPAGGLSQSDEQLWGLLAHIGSLLFGFLAPLVVLLVQGEKSPFVRRHAVESLNFQITLFIGYVISAILFIVLIGIVTMLALVVAHVVFAIIAGVAANAHREYRYPFALRLVK